MNISQYEQDYIALIKKIRVTGKKVQSRNGEITGIFGETFTVRNTDKEFPILSGRQMHIGGILGEFAAMIRGPKHIKDFEKFGCNYWKQWAQPDGSIVLDYGNQWIDFNGVNQIEEVVKSLTNTPHYRRHIIDAWRPDRLDKLSLPCCHFLYQWFVRGKHLDMIWYQRSVDTMIGLPSDVILATIFNMCMATEVGLKPGNLIFMLGDCHIYKEHDLLVQKYLNQVSEVNITIPVTYMFARPVNPLTGRYKFTPGMIKLTNYLPKRSIHFKVIS